MEWAQLDTAKTLTVDLPRRPSAAGTFRVLRPSGTEAQASAAATLDAVNTTASAAVEGASSLTLSDATGVAVGRRYLLAGPEASGGEFVTVKSISGTAVGLVRRTLRAHDAGATFQSTRVSLAIDAATPTPTGRAWRVEYTWPAGDAQPRFVLPFDVTRYAPASYLSAEDLRELDPVLAKRLATGTWLPGVIDTAWDMLLRHVAQKAAPGAFVGIVDLTTAHGYLVRALLAETAGSDDATVAYRDDMRARAAQERDAALAACAYDEAQMGAVKVGGGWFKGIPMGRS